MNLLKSSFTPFYTRLAMILISLIALGYLCILGKPVLSPLMFSFLFSVVLLPVSQYLERRRNFARSASSGLAVLLMVLIVATILIVVGLQISNLIDDWPAFKLQFSKTFKDIQQWISANFHIGMYKQKKYLDTEASKLVSENSGIVGLTLMSLVGTFIFIVFVIIDTFFILFYRRLILRFLVVVFKEKHAMTIYDIAAQVQYIIRRYILGLLAEIGIVSLASCLVFWAIGVRFPILLGLITGLFNIIPYVGIFTSLALTVAVSVGTAATVTQIFMVILAIIIIHLVDSNFLIPFIVASKVKINALITVLAVFLGHMFWGIAGMFLALPVVAICKVVFDRIESMKAWGLLLGDEKDEVEPGELKAEIQEGEVRKNPE